MNTNAVNNLYSEILKKSDGAHKVKVDLHIHTPASKDFVCDKLTKDEAYINILEQAQNNNIQIVAITDHNTFIGFNYLKKLLQKPEISNRFRDVLVLQGIEITCFSKHIIALFPFSFSEKDQEIFLRDIGIEPSVEGTENALADKYGPALLIEKIGLQGGIAILAHADCDKGFLQRLCGKKSVAGELEFSGKSLAKIIQSSALLGVQCNSDTNKRKLIENLNNSDYKRSGNALAFLKCSDCHGVYIGGNYYSKSGSEIGKYFSEIKLSEISFEALKMALIDSEMRIYSDNSNDYGYIEGVAVKSFIFNLGNNYTCFRFCNELNCIIGARGTGKTTILEIIQSILIPKSLTEKERIKAFSKYESAVVYLKYNDDVFAISHEPKFEIDGYTESKTDFAKHQIYIKKKTDSKFKKYNSTSLPEHLRLFLTSGYQQHQLFDYSTDPNKILEIVDDFIRWKKPKEYGNVLGQIDCQKGQLTDLLTKIKEGSRSKKQNLFDYIVEENMIEPIVSKIRIINNQRLELHKLRKEMTEELNGVLIGKVSLSLNKKVKHLDGYDNINDLSNRTAHLAKKYYDYEQLVSKTLHKIYELSAMGADTFDFYILLLTSKFDEIIDCYKIDKSTKQTHEDLSNIRKALDIDDILFFLDDEIKMEYNINSGTEYDVKFKDNQHISMGQNAVALLLLILNASYSLNDSRPLLMDQPEDDLDNSYIYSTLVKEFRSSKQKRQIIISTHNPNVPVAADAENIMVLKYNGDYSYLDSNGAIDSNKTADAILEIMEGGKDAIKRRMDKYKIM